MEIDAAISLTHRELMDATQKFGVFNTPHEGYAVILEELDELWDAIKLKQNGTDEKGRTRTEAIREESIQVAAMALRMLVDCCPISSPTRKPGDAPQVGASPENQDRVLKEIDQKDKGEKE